MLWPVYVASKSRVGRVADAVLSLGPTLVVEEPEAPLYREAYPGHRVVSFPEVDRGVAFARNQVKRLAWEECVRAPRGCSWFWMLDDDLSEFWSAGASEPVAVGASEALRRVQGRVEELEERRAAQARGRGPLALVGLPVFWRLDALDGNLYWNQHCYCCIGMHAERLRDVWYHEPLKLKEDTDFAIAVLFAGWSSVRVHEVAIRMPVCGTQPGGLFATYREDREREFSELLQARWPDYVTLGPKAKKARVDWEKFDVTPERLPVERKGPARGERLAASSKGGGSVCLPVLRSGTIAGRRRGPQ